MPDGGLHGKPITAPRCLFAYIQPDQIPIGRWALEAIIYIGLYIDRYTQYHAQTAITSQVTSKHSTSPRGLIDRPSRLDSPVGLIRFVRPFGNDRGVTFVLGIQHRSFCRAVSSGSEHGITA